ncbi:EpsG family protein [Pseudoalteromonas undina]|uniref:EpsG family protein n=1 Tax=Pseudoalteromonas undina TaxID=43660 RepID=A0ACC6R9E3_9GAMM
MFWYLLAILYSYGLIALRRLPLPVLVISSLPLVAFAALRGSSGKDTGLYLNRFNSFDPDSFKFSLFDEPILNSLIYITKLFNGSHEIFFAFHASLVCILFVLALKRFEFVKLYFFTLGPMFLIDGITNGMRITIAYHLFLVAVAFKREISAAPLIFLSHVTGILLYIAKYFANINKLRKLYQIIVLLISAIIVLVLASNIDSILALSPRINSKVTQYGELILTTKYSGLADLSVLFTLFLAVSLGPIKLLDRFIFLLLGILVCTLFYLSIQQSLAFIRVLKLFLIGLLVSDYFVRKVSDRQLFLFKLIGVLYSLNFIRQIIFGPGFLPYPGDV